MCLLNDNIKHIYKLYTLLPQEAIYSWSHVIFLRNRRRSYDVHALCSKSVSVANTKRRRRRRGQAKGKNRQSDKGHKLFTALNKTMIGN
jgi:hypothetical protein